MSTNGQDTIESLFREALAWGTVYKEALSDRLWDEMREEMVGKFSARLAAIPAPEGALPDAMTYAAARSWAVTKEWCRGWDDARAALAEPAPQAPVALTNEQIEAWWRDIDGEASRLFIAMLIRFARAIEAAHGIPAPQTKEPTNDR